MECGARVVVAVGVAVGLLLVIVWQSVYTPAAHVVETANSTATQVRHSLLIVFWTNDNF